MHRPHRRRDRAVLVSGNAVIFESTSPVGTTEKLAVRLAGLRQDPDLWEPLDVHVAHCPERVLPGKMVRELIENDRIIGGMTEACAEHQLPQHCRRQ